MEREGEERPWPYLLGHTPLERLFISLSHLQHSDTAAVKGSLPHHTELRERRQWKQEVHKSHNQTNSPGRAGASVHDKTCDLAEAVQRESSQTGSAD